MFEVGKPIFVVSYHGVSLDSRVSYRQLSGNISPVFDIVQLQVVEHMKVKGKYHKESSSEKDTRDGYRLLDSDGNEWGIHLPHASLSDLGRSDYVARKMSGLSSADIAVQGVEICYHLNEYCVAVHSDKSIEGGLNQKQRSIINKFCLDFPGWDLKFTPEKSRHILNEGCELFVTHGSFAVRQIDLFA